MKTTFLYNKHFVSNFSPGQEKHFVRGCVQTCRFQNPNIPLAVRVGAAQSGAAGCRGVEPINTPTGLVAQLPTIPLAPQNMVVNCLERVFASTSEGKFVSTDGSSKSLIDSQFITVSFALYPRLIIGTKSASRSWPLNNVPTLICLCEAFSFKA